MPACALVPTSQDGTIAPVMLRACGTNVLSQPKTVVLNLAEAGLIKSDV